MRLVGRELVRIGFQDIGDKVYSKQAGPDVYHRIWFDPICSFGVTSLAATDFAVNIAAQYGKPIYTFMRDKRPPVSVLWNRLGEFAGWSRIDTIPPGDKVGNKGFALKNIEAIHSIILPEFNNIANYKSLARAFAQDGDPFPWYKSNSFLRIMMLYHVNKHVGGFESVIEERTKMHRREIQIALGRNSNLDLLEILSNY